MINKAIDNAKRGLALSVLAILMAVCGSGWAQTTFTKSGTEVQPAQRIFANPQSAPKHASLLPDPTAGTYLIVTRPDWQPMLIPFIHWKRAQGYRVELMVMNTGNSDSIRQQLLARYESSTSQLPAQRYVLLIGDVDRLQSMVGKHTPSGLNPHYTDLYYGEYTGDYLPEAWVGRLAVRDSAELRVELSKIIAYEQGQYAQSHKILLAAGHEQRSPAPITTNGQVNYLSQMMADSISRADTICFRNGSGAIPADSLRTALGQELALVNYTGHCLRTGWNNPMVTNETLDSIGNPIPTVFVNNCCLSNAFNGDCFGEQLMRMPQGGAAAALGATNETLWEEDYYWAIGAKYPLDSFPTYSNATPGAFDQQWKSSQYNPNKVSLGALNYAGCAAVSMAGSPYDAFYWEIYNLLGDPSMTLFLQSPDSLTVAIADTLFAGASALAAYTLPYARVSATQEGELLGTSLADARGVAHIQLHQMLLGDSLTLSATRPGDICAQITLPIVNPTGSRMAAQAVVSAGGEKVTFYLHHVGNNFSSGHKLLFYQDSADRASGAAMSGSIAYDVPAMAEGCIDTLTIDTLTLRWGVEPCLSAHLALLHDADTYALQPITAPLTDISPYLRQLRLSGDAKRISPDTSFAITAILAHNTDSICSQSVLYNNSTRVELPLISSTDSLGTWIEITPHLGNWSKPYEGWIIHNQAIEDWESGDFGTYPWNTDGPWPWAIDSTAAHDGRYSARSYPIHDHQKSVLSLKINTLADDSISFYLQVSSQSGDWLNFYIDGKKRGYWNGGTAWQRYARLISAGEHLLQWVYEKDASGQAADDCARIDDLQLPIAWWKQPCGKNIAIASDTSAESITTLATSSCSFTISPNPATNHIVVTTTAAPYKRLMTLYDSYGRLVDETIMPPNCNSIQYSTTYLRLGIYSLTLNTPQGRQSRKLIVTR